MALTDAQRQERRSFIGSSDAGTLMGVNPYGTLGDLVLSKIYESYELDLGEALEIGNALEPGLVKLAAERLGIPSYEVGTRYTAGILAANLDGEGFGPDDEIIVIETKTAGWMWDGYDIEGHGWGEDGSIAEIDALWNVKNVPAGYYYQVQHQMYCVRKHLDMPNRPIRAVVFAAINGGGMRMIHVPENTMVGLTIATRADEVWVKYVEPKVIPDGEDAPTENALKRVVREPVTFKKTKKGQPPEPEESSPEPAVLDDELVEDYLASKKFFKATEDNHQELKDKIITALGGLDTGVNEAGTVMITYKRQSSTKVSVNALRDRFPQVADEVSYVSSFPVLRDKKIGGAG